MKISARPIGGSRLVQDYLAEVPAALAFYSGSPFRLGSFRRKIEEVAGRFGPAERERAAAAVVPTSEAAAARLRRFVSEGGVMVTTGQQAGFLTGPLYTLYKAVSTATLARHLEAQFGLTVVPVFWIASEDHDWAEVNHAYLLDPHRKLRRFQLDGVENPPLPMSDRKLEGDLETICDDVLQVIAGEHDAARCIRSIVDPYREPGRSVAGAFTGAVLEMLRPFDMVVADAAGSALKQASRGVIEVALADSLRHEERLSEREQALEAAGYGNQVTLLEGGTNVFLHDEAIGRTRLYRSGRDFVVRERRGVLAREELLSRVEREPGRFSPNVLLRPVVESVVFPTVAYVGGPGEVGYFAQAGALFEACGLTAPVVVPRYSGTVLEVGIERALEKLGLTEAELACTRDELRERIARREMPEGAFGALAAIRAGVVEGYEALAAQVEGIDGSVGRSLGRLRNRSLLDAWRAERKIIRAIKRIEGDSLARLDRVLDTLRPMGSPQDRVLNVLSFLGRYGDFFLTEVARAIQEQWRLPDER